MDNELKELLKNLESLLFRIADESVPLFSSNRLKNVHNDCAKYIPEIRKQLAKGKEDV